MWKGLRGNGPRGRAAPSACAAARTRAGCWPDAVLLRSAAMGMMTQQMRMRAARSPPSAGAVSGAGACRWRLRHHHRRRIPTTAAAAALADGVDRAAGPAEDEDEDERRPRGPSPDAATGAAAAATFAVVLLHGAGEAGAAEYRIGRNPLDFVRRNLDKYEERLFIADQRMPKPTDNRPGYAIISYARLMELLAQKKVKRITLFGPDSQDCLVEVPKGRVNPIIRGANFDAQVRARLRSDPNLLKDQLGQGLPGKRVETHVKHWENYIKRGLKFDAEGRRIRSQARHMPFVGPDEPPGEWMGKMYNSRGLQSAAADRSQFTLENTVMDDRWDPNLRKNSKWDGSTMFNAVAERNEFEMRKRVYFCPMPGDFWLDAKFLNTIKNNCPLVDKRENKVLNPLKKGQVRCDLTVFPENEGFPPLVASIVDMVPKYLTLAGLAWAYRGYRWFREVGPGKRFSREELAMKEFGASKANMVQGKTGVSLDMVAGQDTIKNELIEIVTRLKEEGGPRLTLSGPARWRAELLSRLGSLSAGGRRAAPGAGGGMRAEIPKGVILQGPPGTGKTYLAKAIANDMGVPFYAVSGSDFVEMFAGVAASRMKDLFAKARDNAPAIIFIDEIDAIGAERAVGDDVDSGTQERESGLLEMLVQLDGVVKMKGVLCIGATNRFDILDKALVRAGRFERVYYFTNPDRANRLRILQIHLKAKGMMKNESDIQQYELLSEVATLTEGFTGAMLENILNEAAIGCARRGDDVITPDNVFKLILESKFGDVSQDSIPPSPLRTHIAYVAAAEAIEAAINSPSVIEVVSMQARTDTLEGSVIFKRGAQPRRRLPAHTHEHYFAQIVRHYMPRACEECFFGEEEVSNLTQTGVQLATQYANWYVRNSAMHPEMGKNIYDMWMGTSVEGRLKIDSTTAFPETWKMLDDKVREVLGAAYARAKKVTRARREVIRAFAEELLEKGEVPGLAVDRALERHPPDALGAPLTSFGGRIPEGRAPPGAARFVGAGRAGRVAIGGAAAPPNQMTMEASTHGLAAGLSFRNGGRVGQVSFHASKNLQLRASRELPGTLWAGGSLVNWMGLTIDDFPEDASAVVTREERLAIIAKRDEEVFARVHERARRTLGAPADGDGGDVSRDAARFAGAEASGDEDLHYIGKFVPPGYRRFHGQVEMEVPEAFRADFESQFGPLPGPYADEPLDGVEEYLDESLGGSDDVERVFDGVKPLPQRISIEYEDGDP